MIESEMKDGVPMCTLEMYEKDFADRYLVHGIIEKWAKREITQHSLLVSW
ncbi:hypothetical protein ES708_24228 [subsurface metagenome]